LGQVSSNEIVTLKINKKLKKKKKRKKNKKAKQQGFVSLFIMKMSKYQNSTKTLYRTRQ
jgi:CelD/BcsL family acetyltransferase involved in cellulose biosynthesis